MTRTSSGRRQANSAEKADPRPLTTTHRSSLPECTCKLNTRTRGTAGRSHCRWKPRQHFDLTILQKDEEKRIGTQRNTRRPIGRNGFHKYSGHSGRALGRVICFYRSLEAGGVLSNATRRPAFTAKRAVVESKITHHKSSIVCTISHDLPPKLRCPV